MIEGLNGLLLAGYCAGVSRSMDRQSAEGFCSMMFLILL